MRRASLLVAALVLLSCVCHAQKHKKNDKDTSVAVEYIPVEGRSENGVPKELQGKWMLSSGIKKTNPYIDTTTKRLVPGSEIRRDSTTRTTTVNGEVRTTTEVDIERMGTHERRITPAQTDIMHKTEKPSISFYGSNETFSGFTGCNKYSGRYTLSGKKLTLADAAPSTKMVCIGEYDEQDFLTRLKRVTAYKASNGMLELLDDNDVLLTFSRQ